jgi:ribokinase
MIIVFGSINLDLVTRVDRFPRVGETVVGLSFATYPGGKGANQALAAARAGAAVRLFGAVGDDTFADLALASLAAEDVDLWGVSRVAAATGSAAIMVDAAGENCIAVVAGANSHADPSAVPDAALTGGNWLVLQQEVPASANASLLERAGRLGTRVLLNAAPAREFDPQVLGLLDVLVVNEGEAALLGRRLRWPTEPDRFATAAIELQNALSVVVTLGAQGALAADQRGLWRAAPPAVEVVDTTGAGDAFVGAFAAAIERGGKIGAALRFGVAAGSLACMKSGAQTSLPSREAVEAALPSVTVAQAAAW